MDQIDKRTLLLLAETLIRFKAHLAAYGEYAGPLSESEAKRYGPYDTQVRLSQPPIDQMRLLTTSETLEVSALNETLSLVLASVTTSAPSR
jgi:hypothetical protein